MKFYEISYFTCDVQIHENVILKYIFTEHFIKTDVNLN